MPALWRLSALSRRTPLSPLRLRIYLKRLGEQRPIDIAMCAASLLLLLIPTVGSVIPIPAPPVNFFPYAYLVYLLAGIGSILPSMRASPRRSVRSIRISSRATLDSAMFRCQLNSGNRERQGCMSRGARAPFPSRDTEIDRHGRDLRITVMAVSAFYSAPGCASGPALGMKSALASA